ncbi:hypothetical protein LCGC14_0653520 [marine sediment metagenome]|uniref:Uncharacterized protein n=1 Tax=marine sediment metagenome TaxID=412755 RepID=A0A0F9QVQ1_9ZZZZ
MEVSERIKELQKSLANATVDSINRTVLQNQLILFGAEIVDALRVTRQEAWGEGYQAGLDWAENSKGD